MTLTVISLQLANYYVKYPVDVLEDVHIKIGDLYALIDFVFFEMDEDIRSHIILGRPFLTTDGCHKSP